MTWLLRISGVLVSLILVAALILFGLGKRAGAGAVSTSVEIKASPDAVWPWLNGGDKAKEWSRSIMAVQASGPKAAELGDKEIWILQDSAIIPQLGLVKATYLEFTPPRRRVVGLTSPEFNGEQICLLTDLGAGLTRLDIETRHEFRGVFGQLIEPLTTYQAKSKLEADLIRLKSLVESSQL